MSYRELRRTTLASPALISAVKRDFVAGGIERVLETRNPVVAVAAWLMIVVRWLLQHTPRDNGYFRSRWSCAILAALLREQQGVHISAETVRRGLHRMNFVWRRPRPVVGPHDHEHEAKLRKIQRLIARLPQHETVVFQDEVDIHLNPQIGSCWMRTGEQAEVVTPGNNQKYHIAGSLHWRTGRLLLSSPGPRRNAQLFLKHLDDLRERLRVQEDSRGVRQCEVSRLPGGSGVFGKMGPSHRAALPPEVRSRDQPDRTRLVAPTRDDHTKPSMQFA
jgi:putative transposase